ncbi:MAG: holo-ACP synthase [bacterium]
MIKGIGTDLVDVSRIRKASKKWKDRFLEKIFTEDELSYCNLKNNPYPHLAGRFAAKEAVMKALGVGFPAISFKDIEITNHSGPPGVILKGRARRIAKKKDILKILVSISHIDDKASSFAITE